MCNSGQKLNDCGKVEADVYHVDNTGDIITDPGCMRSCAGKKWHRRMQKKLEKDGLCPVARKVDESFKYGDGEILPAKTSYLYAVGVTGKNGALDIAEVEKEEAPPLMSRRAMKDLKVN